MLSVSTPSNNGRVNFPITAGLYSVNISSNPLLYIEPITVNNVVLNEYGGTLYRFISALLTVFVSLLTVYYLYILIRLWQSRFGSREDI